MDEVVKAVYMFDFEGEASRKLGAEPAGSDDASFGVFEGEDEVLPVEEAAYLSRWHVCFKLGSNHLDFLRKDGLAGVLVEWLKRIVWYKIMPGGANYLEAEAFVKSLRRMVVVLSVQVDMGDAFLFLEPF